MAFFEKDELKLLGLFYLESIIAVSFCIIPAFEVLYFLEIGLTLTQVGIIFSIFSLTLFVFEIPTGAFADVYGRKRSVVLGYSLYSIILLSLFFIKDFYGILAVYSVLGGISITFVSGAIEAWPVDNLKKNKKINLVHSFYTKNQMFMNAGLVIAGILGTFLVKQFGLGIIWISTGVSLAISTLILSLPKEERVHHKIENKSFKSFIQQNSSSIRYSISHKIIFMIMIASVILALGYSLTSNLVWQPLLQFSGMPVYYLGYILSASGLIGIFVPYLSKPLLKFFKKEKNLIGMLFLVEAAIVASALLSNGWIVVACLFIASYAMRDISYPLKTSFFQLFVPTKKRATVNSIKSMVGSLGIIVGSPLAGYLADNFGLKATLIIGSLLTVVVAIFYFNLKDSKKTLK